MTFMEIIVVLTALVAISALAPFLGADTRRAELLRRR
jgi:hypothetical protein